MSSFTRLVASAFSGLAAGVTGVYLWGDERDRRLLEDSPEGMEVEGGELTVGGSPEGYPPVASDFVMPFVRRYGIPDLDQVILPSDEYTSCWDSRTRTPRWVVERINIDTVTGPADRRMSSFRSDPRIYPRFQSNLADFYETGFDRGHMAPAADHKTTQEGLDRTFLLSNMTAQIPGFNRGYWSDFELFIRDLVLPRENRGYSLAPLSARPPHLSPPFKDVYVITGPLFLPSKETMPSEDGDDIDLDSDDDVIEVPSSPAPSGPSKWVVKHDIIGGPMKMVAVPTHFFKVIVAEPFPSPEAEASRVPPTTFVAAFAMPNISIPNHTDLRNFLVPLETLESVSGMRFLGEASDSGDLDDDAKAFLDEEAMQERARAGLPPFSEFFGGEAPSTGCRRIESAEHVAREKRRLFRHLCTATSCVGV
ncbi:unnamed protein product [Ascophyllum nodosum]